MEKNITPINQLSWKDRMKSYKKHPGSFILLLLDVYKRQVLE